MSMNSNFTCEACHKTLPKGWTDEEARAEAADNFPGMDPDDTAQAGVVCDDCYRKMMGLPPAPEGER